MGLLQRVFQLYSEDKQAVSYNFLHLTVQEYLSSLHIALQKPSEQQGLLAQLTTGIGDMRSTTGGVGAATGADIVRLFMAGLTGGKNSPITIPLRISS